MKTILIAAALFFSVSPCFAILSPLNQSAEEIEAILKSPELQRFPQSQRITEIHRAGNGYLIKSEQMQVLVEIIYIQTDRPGRQQFRLVFREPKSVFE